RVLTTQARSMEEVLLAASSVEQASEHPLAIAIVRGARARGINPKPVSDFESYTGGGVVGKVDGREVIVGSASFLEQRGAGGTDALGSVIPEIRNAGNTVVFVGTKEGLAGIIAIADPVKETTPEAIEKLHRLGIRMHMLSGDNQRTAEAVARKLR